MAEEVAPIQVAPRALRSAVCLGRRGTAGSIVTSSLALGAVIALVAWHPPAPLPAPGFDPSWVTALLLAADGGLRSGSEIVFAYGPLGFLDFPAVGFGALTALGFLYYAALQLGLAVSVIWAARRSFALLIAVAMALVVASYWVGDLSLMIAVIWAIVALQDEPPPVAAALALYGGAAFSAIELLVKPGRGIVILAIFAIVTAALPGARRRNLGAFAATFLVVLAALWLVSGQGFASVGGFVEGQAELIFGYSAALGRDYLLEGWERPVALAAIAVTLAAAWWATFGTPRVRRVGIVAIVALFAFFGWKDAFVRGEPLRALSFFATMLAPWVALRWRGRARLLGAAGFVALALVSIALSSVVLPHPRSRARAALAAVPEYLSGGEPEPLAAYARSIYDLDPETLELLEGHTVHVDPFETTLVWAYGLEWSPLPMFQSFTAYTAELDRMNAEALSSAEGPERILRHSPGASTIDSRFAGFDSPQANLAMLCNYEPLRTTTDYEVLGRAPDRCGPPRSLGSVVTGYGEPVPVPRSPGEIVVARVAGLEPFGVERLRNFLFRAKPREVAFEGPNPGEYRIVPGTATGGLVLSVPPSVDYPGAFRLAPNARTIEFDKPSGFASPERELRVDFEAVPILEATVDRRVAQ